MVQSTLDQCKHFVSIKMTWKKVKQLFYSKPFIGIVLFFFTSFNVTSQALLLRCLYVKQRGGSEWLCLDNICGLLVVLYIISIYLKRLTNVPFACNNDFIVKNINLNWLQFSLLFIDFTGILTNSFLCKTKVVIYISYCSLSWFCVQKVPTTGCQWSLCSSQQVLFLLFW